MARYVRRVCVLVVRTGVATYAAERGHALQWASLHKLLQAACVPIIRRGEGTLVRASCGEGGWQGDGLVAVFRRAYGLVGWGWLYAPTQWPVIGAIVDLVYSWWAAKRLQLTRRPSLQHLCDSRCDITPSAAQLK